MEKTNLDIKYFKEKLEEELKVLEEELKTVGRRNPDNPEDWEPIPPAKEEYGSADPNEQADNIETYEENTAILKELEIRYNNVKLALKKIEEGTYGICEISEEPIEKERLEANPAAKTCIKHMDVE
jgi:RNA polymerase-binding transcription factor DksA